MNSAAIGFGSDNHSGAHPRILAAIARANEGHMPSYGTDPVSERAEKVLAAHFGPGTRAYFVFNGTAANVLALASSLRPYQAVICSANAHINRDECAAPERMAGVKLLPVSSKDGKLRPDDVRRQLVRGGDQHYAQPAMVSITQPLESGAVYALSEISALAEVCREAGLLLHMDGARLVNAAASLGVSLRALTRDCGVDVLSLGGTKNGLLFGEAVLFFHPELGRDFKYIRKQLGQLPSKTRFIGAQFEEFLGTDLWLQNARHANSMARRLADGLKQRSFVRITHAVETNAVFARIPRPLVAPLRKRFFFYVWDELTFECRLMCTWDTKAEDVDGFLAALDELAKKMGITENMENMKALENMKDLEDMPGFEDMQDL